LNLPPLSTFPHPPTALRAAPCRRSTTRPRAALKPAVHRWDASAPLRSVELVGILWRARG